MKRKLAFAAAAILVIAALGATISVLAPSARPAARHSDLLVEATPQQIRDHIQGLHSPLVLVNFWASWCEPCKEEFPQLLSLREKLAAKGLRVVFVSIDDAREIDAAEQFLREQKVTFPTFYKGTQPMEFVSQIYPKWEGSVPTSLLIGPEFKILDAWEGDATLVEFEKRIMKQLRGS